MNTLFNYLKEFMEAISWPVAVLLIILLLRNKLLLFIMALTKKVDRPGEISITKDGLTIKEYVDKKVEEKQNETISMIAETGIGKTVVKPGLEDDERFKELKDNVSSQHEKTRFHNEEPEDDDPLQKTWEGKPDDKNRRIRAIVKPIPNTKLYKIKLVVESTSKNDPLKGKVWFHLHPTFADPNPVADVVDGKAELNLISYGSFTLGAETDDKTRKLKLNLATDVPGVSEEFKKS